MITIGTKLMAFYPEGMQSSYRLQTAEFINKLDLKITKQDKTYTYVNDQFYSSVFSLRLPKKNALYACRKNAL